MPAAAVAALLALALAAAVPPVAPAPASAATAPPGQSDQSSQSGQSAQSGHPACPDFEFIGARGSGEDNNIPSSTRYTARNPTFGMGGELADLYRRVDATATSSGETIAPYGVPYPAVGIDVAGGDALLSGDLSTYSKSVELGAHAAAAELSRVSRACPETGVVVAGYSQGAQVMVDAVLAATPSARQSLVAAVFFGNTYFDSGNPRDDYGNYDPQLDGYLVHSGTMPASASANGSDWASSFDGVPIFDYCHNGDPICGLVDERTVGGRSYPVRDFAHIVAVDGDRTGDPSILIHHTDYQRGDTANAAQQLRFALGLPMLPAGAPGAMITAPQTAQLGAPADFNAGGSLSDPADPIVSYRWALDAGTADARTITTVTPLLSTSFFTTGRHTVALSVTTVRGASATTSTTLEVAAAATSSPPAPAKVAASPGDGAAALSWPKVAGADFYAVTDARGKLLTAFTPLVAGQETVSWTDTGLANGRARGYRVYAVNSMGRSPASAKVTVTPRAADQRPVSAPIGLPRSPTTLVQPELVWSLGLGVIVLALALTLITTGRGSDRSRPSGGARGRARRRSRASRP